MITGVVAGVVECSAWVLCGSRCRRNAHFESTRKILNCRLQGGQLPAFMQGVPEECRVK